MSAITTNAENMLQKQAAELGAASVGRAVILPGSGVTISETAAALFKLIAPTRTLFNRGGAVVGLVEEEGVLKLEVISPAAARSRFEAYAEFYAWRSGANNEPVLKPTTMSQDMATALLAAEQARSLPPITGLLNCPVMLNTGGTTEIVGRGYHAATGLLITGGETPPEVELLEALAALKELVAEFDFQTPGDRSRALASFITPALKLGGHISASIPVDVAEADLSQAGKTYRQKVVAAVYNEQVALVTPRTGGVGSVDETLNQKLVNGRPFIQLDNFRGRFDSPHIEALLTAGGPFPVRVPYSPEVTIDPNRFIVMLTSNGVNTTPDFANRASIIRNRKRHAFAFKVYPEGDLLAHVRARQPYYLGCVFAVIKEWIAQGRQCTGEARHDFREWCQVQDWIAQNILGEAPLMDGHQSAQERVSNPALTFLRLLALAVMKHGRLGQQLNASALYEIAEDDEVAVPGLKETNSEQGKRQVGIVMGKVFKAEDTVEVDGFRVYRHEEPTERPGGGNYPAKKYRVERLP